MSMLVAPLLCFTIGMVAENAKIAERDPAEWVALIGSKDPVASAEAITALSTIRPASKPVIEAILDALADQRRAEPMRGTPMLFEHVPTVSTIASQALIKIGPAIVPCLNKRLREPAEKELRQLMIRTLSAIGPEAREAIPDLERLFDDPEHDTRLAVLQALLEIEPRVARLSPILARALRDGDPQVRSYAVRAAGNAGLAAATHAPQLVKLLDDRADRWHAISNHFFDSRPVRFDAAMALAEMGNAGRPALANLQAMMHTDDDPIVRVAAAYAIIRLGGHTPAAIRVLIDQVRGESSSGLAEREGSLSQQEAISVLGQLGTQARIGIPALREALEHRDGLVRANATRAIAHIAPLSCEPWLLPIMSDADPIVRMAAIEALSESGCRSSRFTQALTVALRDDDGVFGDGIRIAAAEALGNLGPGAISALPALNQAAENDDSELVRTTSKAAIQKIRQSATDAESASKWERAPLVFRGHAGTACRSSTRGRWIMRIGAHR